MKRQQANIFAETANDLPLFSATPYGPTPDSFTPAEVAQQDSMFDRREYIAAKPNPTRNPTQSWHPQVEEKENTPEEAEEEENMKPKTAPAPAPTWRILPDDGWMDGGEPYTDEEMEIIRAEEGEEEEEE